MAIPELSIKPDGLVFNKDVGTWAADKHRLVGLYADLFATGMQYKWPRRTFVDLYAGAGISRLKKSGELVPGSPLVALSLTPPFTDYVFCERDKEMASALSTRIEGGNYSARTTVIQGDCNDKTDQILSAIPQDSLTLCFVDPFDLGIKFKTLQAIASARKVDFLALLALKMDGNRNLPNYERAESTKIEDFLGNPSWRHKLDDEARRNFPRFLAEQFAESLQKIGYLKTEYSSMKQVTTHDKNIPLYHLALFSKHTRAFSFWKEVLKWSTPQRQLFD